MPEDEEGLPVETISFAQFMRAIAGQEAQGTPTGEIAYPVKKVEPITGTELHKKRVRVSFDFDVAVSDGPILNSAQHEDIKAHDLALLKSFLLTPQLLDMLIDHIGCELGLNSPETFIRRFFPQINTECHSLFSKAIDTLSGEDYLFWREIQNAPDNQWGDHLSQCTETIFDCFTAQFMSSTYEMVEEQAMITWQDCLNKQDELIETIKLKMQQDPEHGKLWQEKLALMLHRRQEILIKAEQEKREQEA